MIVLGKPNKEVILDLVDRIRKDYLSDYTKTSFNMFLRVLTKYPNKEGNWSFNKINTRECYDFLNKYFYRLTEDELNNFYIDLLKVIKEYNIK